MSEAGQEERNVMTKASNIWLLSYGLSLIGDRIYDV